MFPADSRQHLIGKLRDDIEVERDVVKGTTNGRRCGLGDVIQGRC